MPTTANGEKLRFGAAIPDGVRAAWGARFIVTQDGHVDLPWDRQDSAGAEQKAFLDLLNERFGLPALYARIGELLRSGEMNTRTPGVHVLHSDDQLEVVADTHGSAGYCYVAAWPKGEPA